ncbi:hypothetical protein OsJ_29258 [Oryza sativa Japonica Group]|uniref:CCD97-like C-terminal domain-containing protein n=1 Tax=Oryza sativa subsp. japonica TaxID=39947 RepID=B9G3F0_ORYSJ|nr:hypothetical protein OsJ_29258 [Oryza sativa Japonica Group]
MDRAAIHSNTRTSKFTFGPDVGIDPGVGCIPRKGGFGACSTPKHKQPNEALGMVDSNKTGGSPAGTSKQTLSAEEMDDQLEQFTSLMQQKFLSGEDFGHMDYSRIDNDEMLDDHWSKEANYDAGEKYFEED